MEKIYFISDLHFGVRNASHEWIKNQMDYFDNFFIPFIDAENVDDKYLLVGGDVFDNRQNLNIYILNHVYELFLKLSTKFKEIHIIIGNHDISNKTTNNIHSLIFLNALRNVFVYKKPELKTIGNAKFLMLPWVDGKEATSLEKYSGRADYVLMHTDISTLRFNKYKEISDGVNINYLKSFKYVFSGHIHYGQERDNIIMLGSPYHLNRNDLENTKYIYSLNTATNKLSKHINIYSPLFKQIDFFELIELTEDKYNKVMNNNYMYISIKSDLSFDNTINVLLNNIKVTPRDIKFIYYEDELISIDGIDITKNESIEKNIDEYIDAIDIEDDTRIKIKKIISNYRLELNN